jgi:hypothetical protein
MATSNDFWDITVTEFALPPGELLLLDFLDKKEQLRVESGMNRGTITGD